MRLFVAVDPPEPLRSALGAEIEGLRRLAPGAKWVRPESIHVTLAFLGATDDEKVPAISQALERVGRAHRPLVLEARGGGAFGGKRKPRVLWVGLEGDLEPLAMLQKAVEEALVPLGYQPEERAFRPHLTLARARDPRGDPALAPCAEELQTASLGSFPVEELILYRSDLSPKGAVYTPVARAPLALRP